MNRMCFTLTVLCCLLADSETSAEFTFTGIIDEVSFTRTNIGSGLDSIVVAVDVGSDEFTTIDGGFLPRDGASFNQATAYADATPPALLFEMSTVPADDTTFLLPRDFGDPDADGTNTDTAQELSTLSMGYASPISGAFELARLVLPSGGHAEIRDNFVDGEAGFALVSSGQIVGRIFGDTVVPEPSAALLLVVAAVGLVGQFRGRRLLA